MLNRILYAADGAAGLSAPPAPSPNAKPASAHPPASKPSSPPPAAKPAASTPAAPPQAELVDDDPFSAPKQFADSSAPKKPDEAKPDAAPAPAAEPDFDKLAPKELRERVKQLNTEKKTLGEQIKGFEEKIKQLDSRGADTSALTARLTALEKERDGYQAELRAAKQEASPEFKEKYEKPFNSAADQVQKDILDLTVVGEDGNPRPAVWSDFTDIYSSSVGNAIKKANALFGDAAHFVLQQREKLIDLQRTRDAALAEEKTKYKERSAQEVAEQARRRENFGKDWVDTNTRLSQTDAYKVDVTDAELAEAAKHAEGVFDAKVQGADRDDWAKKKILKDAHIKQKTIGYAVRGVIINRLKAANEALQNQVEELKGTAAGGTVRTGGGTDENPESDSTESWISDAHKAMKMAG